MLQRKNKFDFDDMHLIPRLCKVNSRSECDTSIQIGKHIFKLPIIPANMESVVNQELCIKLAQNNYFYIMHRFSDTYSFAKQMKELGLIISISVGVNDDSYELLYQLKHDNIIPDYITIDIAHGHSIKTKQMIEFIKSEFKNCFIIGGNVASLEAVEELDVWGCDAIKCGIGPSSVCTTFHSTGFGTRNIQPYFIYEASKITSKLLILDGGIKHPGDITKSIVLGADLVMVGGMLSNLSDSPGSIVEKDGVKYKTFHGSASMHQSNKKNRIEGTMVLNKMENKTLLEQMSYLEECLQSAISYGGGKTVDDLLEVKWI